MYEINYYQISWENKIENKLHKLRRLHIEYVTWITYHQLYFIFVFNKNSFIILIINHFL